MSPTPFLRLLRLSNITRTRASLPRTLLSHHTPNTTRPFTNTPTSLLPRKDSQHKDSIDTTATEYSKSGSDDAAAREESAAFDPSITSPESEKSEAGKGGGGNPLDVSPANQEVSKPRGEQEGGAERSPGDKNVSGRKGSGFGGK
ncbi:uncharacterized protein EAE97_006754 [Botrytis byssoidea]|uniref:Uncharacterized protein n=1 Tax=Botrytis byssoidea TaxID=139641 RepID=A0A9P5IIB0_9HELO|nr:uncharacterized protein EAE97_006754 [Botrytis byssoidea]KAF7941917.1 hypothetical protein EAE97_006754 [Botrytis byssoidea]